MAKRKVSTPERFTSLEIEGLVAKLPRETRKSRFLSSIKSDAKLRRIHRKIRKQFVPDISIKSLSAGEPNLKLRQGDIVGTGIGEKRVNGSYTGEVCIKFHVRRKVHSSLLNADTVIPATIDGVATDVESSGELHALNGLPPKRLQPGEVIKNIRGDPAGTLGCLVTNGTDLFLLSNNHVLALLNQGNIRNLSADPPENGDIIVYRLTAADGSYNDYSIGYLFNYVALNLNQGVNVVDCAIALVDCRWVEPDIYSLGNIDPRPALPYHGQPVQKFGFHGKSTGFVDVLNYAGDVNYPEASARFVEQFTITGTDGYFATDGDSGSLVVEQGTNRAVGLVVAGTLGGTSPFTLATPIGTVLNALGMAIAAQLPTTCYL
jgi:hypothetical protein